MSCYHPLKGFPVGVTATGKTDYYITSYDVDHLESISNGWRCVESFAPVSANAKIVRDSILIPCGHCIGCRLDYSRVWATRMMLESMDHSSNYFITLTYDDDHMPMTYYPDPETGEAFEAYTLVKRDVQLFVKRLRRALDRAGKPSFRYYLCGEYGDQSFRPHYHLVCFGLELDDLIPSGFSHGQDPYWFSPFISSVWSKGFSLVADVNWKTCAYVARYATKKLTGYQAGVYDTYNIQPQFALMSRKPGIGYNYYDLWRDHIYDYDKIVLPEGLAVKPPRYYDKLFEVDNPDALEIVKGQRVLRAKNHLLWQHKYTDLDDKSVLLAAERLQLLKSNSLIRSDV